MGLPAELDRTVVRGDDYQIGFTFTKDTVTVTDGVTTDGSTTVTSAKGRWSAGDVNKPIYGGNIPFGTKIATYVSATQVTISHPAEEDGTSETFMWGTAIDVSGWAFSSGVKGRADYTSPLAQFTVDDSQGAAALLTLSLTDTQTRALPTGPLAWDIVAVISGQRVTLFSGTLHVRDGVTP